MTMQITGWIFMRMQIGPGKTGRDTLPSHSYLDFATYGLLTSAGGDLLGWVADARKESPGVLVRAARGCRSLMDHHWPGLS